MSPNLFSAQLVIRWFPSILGLTLILLALMDILIVRMTDENHILMMDELCFVLMALFYVTLFLNSVTIVVFLITRNWNAIKKCVINLYFLIAGSYAAALLEPPSLLAMFYM